MARPTGTDALPDGRGVAVADLDGDGGLDLVIQNNGAPPTIYRNRVARRAGRWTAFELEGRISNRDAVGARVALTLRQTRSGEPTETTLLRVVEAGSGYASQSPHRLHFGLGPEPRLEALDLVWPSGARQRWNGEELAALDPVGRTIRLVEPEAFPASAISTTGR